MDLHRPIEWHEEPDDEKWWRAETERRVRRVEYLYRQKDPERKKELIRTDLELCRRDFRFWVQQWGWMYNPKADAPHERDSPVVLWPKQHEWLDWLEERTAAGDPALTPKSRELGVTWLCLLRLRHWYFFERGFSALIGSRNEKLVDRKGDSDSLFEKLRKINSSQPPHLRMHSRAIDNKLLMSNPITGSELAGESTNEGFGQGKRRKVLFIDEVARVDPTIFANIWLAIESTADTQWLVYNPGTKGHLTYELHMGDSPLDQRFIFELDWTADPRRDDEWKQSKIRPAGRLTEAEFASAYECKYGYTSTGKIWDVVREDVEYHEHHPDWKPKAERVRKVAFQVGGWDFGSGLSDLVCIFGLLELGARPTLWIDNERRWNQTEWRIAGADTVAVIRGYGGYPAHFGDPAGANRESDQKSWETNLQSAGVPLSCLPRQFFAERTGIEWMIKLVQSMIDDGRLRVHRRCRYLWKCIESWRRNVKEGVQVEFLSKAYVGPRKDVFSHGGNALMYLAAGAALVMSQERSGASVARRDLQEVPEGAVGEILKALG